MALFVGDGIGEAEDEEATLGGVVGPIEVALEGEIVHLEEEGEGTVVAVFDLGIDTIAQRQFVAIVGDGLAEEVSFEVEEPLVLIVEVD